MSWHSFFYSIYKKFLDGGGLETSLRIHSNLPDLGNSSVGKIETTETPVNTGVFFCNHDDHVLFINLLHNFFLHIVAVLLV